MFIENHCSSTGTSDTGSMNVRLRLRRSSEAPASARLRPLAPSPGTAPTPGKPLMYWLIYMMPWPNIAWLGTMGKGRRSRCGEDGP